jgi:tetratricopeptide (TPR) repeat protein
MSSALPESGHPQIQSTLRTTGAGRREEALKTFDRAVQLRPDSAELWKNLDDVLTETGATDEALLGFQHALKLDPHNSEATDKSASLLSELSRLK